MAVLAVVGMFQDMDLGKVAVVAVHATVPTQAAQQGWQPWVE